MNQCTTFALLPPPDHLIALSPAGHRPEAGHVLCELGEDHDDQHAAMLWDEGGRPGSAVWVRWKGSGRAGLTSLSWCPAHGTRNEACELFAAHSSAHSWDITDPTVEAITLVLARQHPYLFPRDRGKDGS
ncbi:hypothetical protein ACTFBT_27075 [Streptomyces microflavus]|uniref:Uncharacterized protein n=1 Tax=Streptomyces microflavus TaxID=1919 RepID=A0A7J0CZ40_STRMI|nr:MULTISPECIES: hypothetical protein [Streptomyces]MDX2975321.1 hypothetical protein [Streptomyces sp. NRRL_B-2249]WSS34116.1 hypothetical protein OG269_11790 [Streptomyces microflavus]WST17318.1 hypothetical protein OG721_26755 [Streptomyces microflavus]SCK08639.1 hypothetical protein YUYDRAFT_00528 [Streptomyces sp. ScaeMP-e48]GFN07017.1 hypothetical protein Smic_55730 [Streptomyces microflavus]